jgi:hypothetical protein
VTWLLIAGVVVLLGAMKFLGPQWWFLEDLALRAGEVEVLREEVAWVNEYVAYAPRPAFGNKATRQWPRCTVLLTNQRMVVAQKGLGSAKLIIRVIFEFGAPGLDERVPTGGQLAHIGRGNLRVEDGKLWVKTPTIDYELPTANAARYLEPPTSA